MQKASPFPSRTNRLSLILSLIALCGWVAAGGSTSGTWKELERSFRTPPPSARPWVYWMWMDGNLSREGLTADLEAMAKAGIGGVIIMEVDAGIPRGPVEFMSAEWRSLFKHVILETERLGLQVTLNAGPGWTGSGGPWVPLELSMQHLVASSVQVKGPTNFNEVLPTPKRRPAFFGDGALPPEQEKAKNEFYRDEVVLAFPSPEGNLQIPDIDEKALYVRAPYSSQPGVKPFLPSIRSYPGASSAEVIQSANITNISACLNSDGRLSWTVLPGDWTIMRFGRTSTGANTRPAPRPGIGLESDKLSTAALEYHFDKFVGTLLRELGREVPGKAGEPAPLASAADLRGAQLLLDGGQPATGMRPSNGRSDRGWTSLHIDSWEMGAQNWTPAFRDEFKSRRGYDPLHYLPTFAGRVVDGSEISERFLWDVRQTVQELIVEKHAKHLKQLGERAGLGLSIEPYDMTPCANMVLGSVAEVPMCEFWLYGFDTAYSVIEAASVAHVLGRPVVAAEAFTSTDEERWRAHPASMKALGDWAFCAGVNRIVFHRYQHQPWLDRFPGMTMGPYGVHWERTQTWWDMVPAYHEYLARCQHLLRQGLPVADICYLISEGAPHVFRPPASATKGNPPDRLAYNFDGCTPDSLLEHGEVRNGKLVFSSGMSYRVLVLPESATMTPRLLRKIRDLVRGGLTVIGPPPARAASLSKYPGCDSEVARLASELWGSCDGERVTSCSFGAGRIIWKRQMVSSGAEFEQFCDYKVPSEALAEMGVAADFEVLSKTASNQVHVRYAHRALGDTDCYFVANASEARVAAACVFRVTGKIPELWDPLTGQVRELAAFEVSHGQTTVPLQFESHQSFFVVFRTRATVQKAGTNFHEPQDVIELRGPWNVSFDPKWGGPADVIFPELTDWTARQEPGIRFYSGKAIYRKMSSGADLGKVAGQRLAIDLGMVNYMARLRLNGEELGVVWCAPWQVELGKSLKQGNNLLEIEVANLWPNRLIGDEQYPADAEYNPNGALTKWPDWVLNKTIRPSTERLTFATWKLFKKDSPLLPSGLLGPVKIKSLADH